MARVGKTGDSSCELSWWLPFLQHVHGVLERAENGGVNDSVICANLSPDEARHSRQLYNVVVLWFSGSLLELWARLKALVREGVQLRGVHCTNSVTLAHGADSLVCCSPS